VGVFYAMTIPYSRFLYPIILVVILFVVFAPSLNGNFHYDDGHSILRNPAIGSIAHIPSFYIDPRLFSENPDYAMYRPMVLTSYAVNYTINGLAAPAFLVGNLLIHCLVSILVFGVLRELGFSNKLSFFAALLFAIHPIQTEPVNYISARSESLAALGVLGAFGAYLRSLGRQSPIWILLSLIIWAIGLFSKATALVFPAVLLAYLLIMGKPRRYLLSLIPFSLLAIGYVLVYLHLTPQAFTHAGQVRTLSAQIATQAKALVYYIELVFFPIGLNVHPQFFAEISLAALLPWISLLLIASLVLCGIVSLKRYPLVSFGLVWFFVCLAPTLLIPLNILVNNHRLYLPLFGFILLLCVVAARIRRLWPFYFLTLLWALMSWQHSAIWKTEVSLWQHAAINAPLMPEAHYNLGFAWHQAGQMDKAKDAYEKAVALDPQYSRALTNLATIYRKEARFEEALEVFHTALKHDPQQIETLNNLGLTYTSMGQYQSAINTFQSALQFNSTQAEVWFNLGLAYRDSNQSNAAFKALSRALELDPTLKKRFPASGP